MGADIEYDVRGSEAPVVFIHGAILSDGFVPVIEQTGIAGKDRPLPAPRLCRQFTRCGRHADGIRLPSTRRAYTRRTDFRPKLDPLMVSIDISDVRFSQCIRRLPSPPVGPDGQGARTIKAATANYRICCPPAPPRKVWQENGAFCVSPNLQHARAGETR
jgi:hypothetical protein